MGDASDSAGLETKQGRLIRAPLVPPAAALAAGCLAGRYLPAPISLWMLLGAAGLIAAFATLSRPRLAALRTAAILAAVVSLGAVRMHQAWFSVPRDDIVTYTGRSKILATIRGRVASFPQIFSPNVEFGYRPEPRVLFLLDVDEILTDAGRAGKTPAWREARGLVRVTVDEPYVPPRPGERLEIQGWMGRFAPPGNPGQYDTAAAARRGGTWVWFRAPSRRCVHLLQPNQGARSTALWRLRATLRQHLVETGDLQSGRLLNALILGERDASLGTLNRTMQRAGVAHFLSISGLHLGVFLGFVYLLCRLLLLRPRTAAIVSLAVLGAYLLLAEPRPPLLRSAIMAAALLAGVIVGRPGSTLNALGLATILLLLIDPRQILQPGFQMSFAIVAGLIFLFYPMRRFLFGRRLRRRGLVVFRGDQRVRRWLHYSVVNRLIDAVSLAVTCYVVAAPLAAVQFGVFSPWAIGLNLLLFPLVAAVLIPGYVSMALAWPAPNLAAAVGSLSAGAADLLARVVEAFEVLPGLSLPMRPVGVGWGILCYATLAAVLFARGRTGRRILAGVLIAALAGVTVWTQLPAGTPEAQLDLLAVGGGQCAVLQTPAGETHIIDAGTRSGFDVYRRVLAPFLREMRLPNPREAYVSHANSDHYNALPNLAGETGLETLYVCDYFGLGESPFSASRQMLERLHAAGAAVHRLRRGDRVQLDERTRIDVLWPPAGREGLSANDSSLVLRVTCDEKSLLLTGDVEELAQAELLKDPAQLKADALVLPHHGGWAKTLPAFVEAVGPSVILISAGREPKGPSAGRAEIREFYDSLRVKYRCFTTPRNGWIRLRFGRGGQNVRTMR
ncbi:MAG: ComEC/Rec2 family competence protein [Phycisphaerae bacterium]|nr:ComEC/Rec2 family competence protein [Phycisphaerae bacterium]